jgi:hypothetical protein
MRARGTWSRRRVPFGMAVVLALADTAVAGPPSGTMRAFRQYSDMAAAGEAASARPGATFLWTDENPVRRERVRAGLVAIEPSRGSSPADIPGGLVHDWTASVLIPGAHVDEVIRLLQDYNRHKVVYAPDVLDSRLLKHDGRHYAVRMRLLKKMIVTVVLDTDHDATFTKLSEARWQSRSVTTAVREVRGAGTAAEHALPEAEDHGFMWALHSFWRLDEKNGGVYVECRAISLSRRIPTGLGWVIGPIIRELPREALERTLDATRRAAQAARSRGDAELVLANAGDRIYNPGRTAIPIPRRSR